MPLTLLVLAIFVAARLIQMALDPSARQNGSAASRGGASPDVAADLH